MAIIYREVEGVLSETVLYEIATLAQEIDDRPDVLTESYVQSTRMGIAGRNWVHVGLAYDDDELVGYKLSEFQTEHVRTYTIEVLLKYSLRKTC